MSVETQIAVTILAPVLGAIIGGGFRVLAAMVQSGQIDLVPIGRRLNTNSKKTAKLILSAMPVFWFVGYLVFLIWLFYKGWEQSLEVNWRVPVGAFIIGIMLGIAVFCVARWVLLRREEWVLGRARKTLRNLDDTRTLLDEYAALLDEESKRLHDDSSLEELATELDELSQTLKKYQDFQEVTDGERRDLTQLLQRKANLLAELDGKNREITRLLKRKEILLDERDHSLNELAELLDDRENQVKEMTGRLERLKQELGLQRNERSPQEDTPG